MHRFLYSHSRYPKGVGARTPAQIPKSMDAQVPYRKWHSICV